MTGMFRFLLALSFIPAFQTTAFAWYYADVSGSLGLGMPGVVSGEDRPLLAGPGLGVTAAWKHESFGLGVTSDYRIARQYSDIKPLVGNFAGSRWNMVSPTVLFANPGLVAKLDFQFLGNYVLSNKTSKNETVEYTSPLGGRLWLLFPTLAISHVRLGVFFETLFYRKQKTSSLGTRELKPAMGFWTAGISFSLVAI